MRRPALLALLLILGSLVVLPASAAPCPWGTNCITVTQLSPGDGGRLEGTVQLEARAVQDQPAERGAIIAVEWWLYHPSFSEQVPGNAEAKILLDESMSPASGTTTNGVWRGNWTVASTLTTRDGWYDSPGDRTYQLPPDDGRYTLEAHVLDEEWVRTWGPPPGRSATIPVSVTFPGSGPDDPGGPGGPSDPPPPTDPGDPSPPPGAAVNIGGLTLPTSVEVLPNGRVYVSEKNGAIRTARDLSASTVTTVATVDTYTNGDHGLQSLAYLDGFLYAAYTRQPAGFCDPGDYGQNGRGCVVHGQVDRFAVNASTGALGPRQAVRGGPGTWCAQFTTHGIDDIIAGEDGFLYVSAGDGAGFTGADTGQFDGDPCGDRGALRGQSTTNLAGNIVRMNPSTGATTTLAYGFRNPYRITLQPGTTNLFVGDVGWYTAEEINRVNTAGPVTNHGWPCREGTGPMSFYAGLPACAGVTGTAPIFSYQHNGDNAAISAIGWHDGRIYYGDYHRRFIRSVRPDGSGDRAEASDVMPVDLRSTSAGLIYVDIGRGAVRTVAGTGEPPASPPFAEVVVSEAPWEPGATIDYAVDFRNLGRQPVRVDWTITLDDADSNARVVHTDTGTPAGPDGRHAGSFTAPSATYPASLTFRVEVSNASGARATASQTRGMVEPPAGPGDPDPPPPPPATNLMPNPSLEQATGRIPDCWFEGGWGTAGTWSRVATAHTGSAAHRVTISGYSSGDRKLLPNFTSACAPAVDVGATYDLSAYYTSTSPAVAFVGYTRNASTGSWDYWFSSASQGASSTWRQARATTPPVPAGVDRISWGLSLYGNGTLTTDTYAMVPTGGATPPPPPPPPPPPSTPNLVVNPDLEQATGAVPTCWLEGGWGSNTRAWSRVSAAHTGSFAHRLNMSSFVNGDGKLVQAFTTACAPAVAPGQTYVLSAHYTATAQPFFIGFVRSASTGAWSYWFEGGTQPTSSSYRQATITTPPVPAGADRISWGLALAGNGQLTTDAYLMTPTTTSGSGGLEALLEQPPSLGYATSDTAIADGPPPPMPPPDDEPPQLRVRGPRAGAAVAGTIDLGVEAVDRIGVATIVVEAGRNQRTLQRLEGVDPSRFDTRVLPPGRNLLRITAEDVNGNRTTVLREVLVRNTGRHR